MQRIAIVCQTNMAASYILNVERFLDSFQHEFSVHVFFENQSCTVNITEYDGLYFFKTESDASVQLARHARGMGIPVIYETDDNFLAFSDGSFGKVFVLPQRKLRNIKKLIELAQLVLCCSRQSLRDFLPLNPHVAIMPVFQEITDDAFPEHRNAQTVIGFMGSKLKEHNFTCVVPALQEIHKRYPGVIFEFLGFVPKAARTLPNLRFNEQYFPYDLFIHFFHKRAWTVALAPLADLAFNRSKTNNKYREYAAAGYPGVYSNVEPYSLTVRHGETGLLANNTEEDWFNGISTLLEQPEHALCMARNAWQDMRKNYTFEAVRDLRIHLMKTMLDKPSPQCIARLIREVHSSNRQLCTDTVHGERR